MVFRHVNLWERTCKLLKPFEDRPGDRMCKLLLCGRGQAEHLLRRMSAATENAADFRLFASQRPGLIEQHGVHLAHLFKCATVLNQNTMLRAKRERRQHAQWRSHPYAGAALRVNHGERCTWVRDSRCKRGNPKRRHYRKIRKVFSSRLRI